MAATQCSLTTTIAADRQEQTAETAAFTRDVRPLMASLLRDALQLTRAQADAEDLLQDTLMHAYKGLHGFQPGTNLRAWLRRIMRNRWVSDYRRRERRPSEMLADDIHEKVLGAGTHAQSAFLRPSAEDDVLAKAPRSDLQAAMNVLPHANRLVIYYVDVEGYPIREVARIMDIPVGTVMSRLHRSRGRLRTELTAGPMGP
ncbi:MAG: sigma-70 family RNA polymerase sigma factor [Actinomycetota bacterium]